MEMRFKRGDQVEICCNEAGFENSYFPATIISQINNKDEYIVQYNTLMRQDEQLPLREFRTAAEIRPVPPEVEAKGGYSITDVVDAYANDGWWKGKITKTNTLGRFRWYYVKFERGSQVEVGKNRASSLRVHHDWVDADGTWSGPALRVGERRRPRKAQPRKGMLWAR